jgi:hypothetical protein
VYWSLSLAPCDVHLFTLLVDLYIYLFISLIILDPWILKPSTKSHSAPACKWLICARVFRRFTLSGVLFFGSRHLYSPEALYKGETNKISLLADVCFPAADFVWWQCSTATAHIWLCLGEHHSTDKVHEEIKQ